MKKFRVMLACLGVAVSVLLVSSESEAINSAFMRTEGESPPILTGATSTRIVVASARGTITGQMAVMDAVKIQCHTASQQYANEQTDGNSTNLHECIQAQWGINTFDMCWLLSVAANDACKDVHGGIFDSNNDECQENFIESANAFPVWAREEGYCGWH